MTPTFSLGFASIGSGILGSSLDSHLPVGITNPLTKTAQITSNFVGPVATLGVMDFTFKQFKKLKIWKGEKHKMPKVRIKGYLRKVPGRKMKVRVRGHLMRVRR